LPTTSLRVAVVSDDPRLCAHLLDCLQLGATGAEGLFRSTAADRQALISAAPEVVVLDFTATGALGLCADLSFSGRTAVIVINVPDNGNEAVEALTAGARGMVYAAQPLIDVARAVEAVLEGRVWAPRHIVAGALMRVRANGPREQRIGEPDLLARLSAREREVYQHAAFGLGNKEVAQRLAISEATVKVHLTHIFQKLGLRGRGELAAAYFGIRR